MIFTFIHFHLPNVLWLFGSGNPYKFDILCILILKIISTSVLNYDRTLSDFEMGARLEPRGHLNGHSGSPRGDCTWFSCKKSAYRAAFTYDVESIFKVGPCLDSKIADF